MNTLLQGDVGSGKTVVAVNAALIAIQSGHQAAIMAPTEVLAGQHRRSVESLLSPIGAVRFSASSVRATKGDQASLLDGGIQAWQRTKFPFTTEIPRIARTDYRPRLRAELVASAEWVRDRLNDPAIALVDARTPAEYAGKDVRAKRGGHIPGAVNIDWRENLRPDGTFKPADELRRMYVAKAVTPDKTAVTYCQTHHRAAHSYFVLRLLGYPRVVGYDRSWIEWGNRDDLPIAQ